MSNTDKTTEASKTELTDQELDGAQGGAGYLKIGDIKGESVDPALKSEYPLNFSKIETEYVEQDPALSLTTSTLKR